MEGRVSLESMAGLKGKTIIVTGGNGFIGSHLVEELLNLGVKTISLDIQLQPYSFFFINKLHKRAPVEFTDVRDKNEVMELCEKYSPDYVIHLAAEAIVGNAYDNPYRALETNIIGTVNILEAVRTIKKIKGVIVASSDKAYGKTKETDTEDFPLKGDHPYDVSKSSADLISQAYNKTYNLPVIITRFGNVYGEGDLYFNRIIPGICEAVIKKKTLLIRSNGKYVRDYLYVKDVVEGYITLLNKFEKGVGEAFNFSSADTLSVIELIKEAEKILGVKIPYKILNNAKNEIPYQHLDDSRIRKLNWGNKYCLKDTLPAIVEWYKKIL